MWSLWTKAKTYHKLPSEVFGEEDALAAWMLDTACTLFGTVIENALYERVEVGSGTGKRSVARYKLPQLLDESFRLPRHDEEESLEGFRGVDGGFYDEVS